MNNYLKFLGKSASNAFRNKINELLGYVTKSEVVHKDDMVEI